MPNLHELFDAASDGLPPLPDLAPAARRIVRRRKTATRCAAAALSSALVIGAGTFVLSGQHAGGVANIAGSTPRAFSNQYVLDTLRGLWPINGQHLALDPDYGQAIVVSEGGKSVGRMFFQVNPDSASVPGVLGCMYGDPGVSCTTMKTADGDRVLVEHATESPIGQGLAGTAPLHATATSEATATAAEQAHSAGQGGSLRAYRLHGTSLGQLSVVIDKGTTPTDQQLFALVESTAYEQLIESATAASSFEWLGTPPATATQTRTATQTATAAQGSTQARPPTPGASVTPPRGSDSARPPATP
ncbi:hypothetical protein [Actinocrinis sp.]|uniref:hypothetical protein n=1 Tax=Actinocrinis sp. TaxID=1920516 RepID=UPI002C7BCDB0|nr:hypothetical protein [Actinocrinis sp.]HXR71072.1 hypothetical protein [Actinocrinis sp.]